MKSKKYFVKKSKRNLFRKEIEKEINFVKTVKRIIFRVLVEEVYFVHTSKNKSISYIRRNRTLFLIYSISQKISIFRISRK